MVSKFYPSQPPRSIWTRKRDMFYIAFLVLFSFFAFALDFAPHVPIELPSWAMAIHDYHRANLNDPLYVKNPPFFQISVLIEAIYVVPVCAWSIRGLIQDGKMVRVHLLVLSTHLLSSSAVCLAEFLSTEDWPKEDINQNLPAYLSFLVVAAILWVDSFLHVKTAIAGKEKSN